MKQRICCLFLCSGVLCVFLLASAAGGDWPMWGGTPERNLVSGMKGLPVSWDIENNRNVKWTAKLGSDTYGNPVVDGGRVFVGTNNALALNPREPGDRAVLMCFRESDGRFLWQHTHERLKDDHQDWPETGLCSTPAVEGGRVYYVSNRGQVVALDAQGDGKGGASLVWSYDMRAELGVHPHHKFSSSPVVFGNLVYVNTSNGPDENHERVPSPNAPHLVAIDKTSGKLAWKAGPSARLYDGQWSSPAAGVIGGAAQIVIGGGDGWVRGYDASSGNRLWEFDTSPKGVPAPAANIVIATPVISDGKVYVANGHDPESGQGPGGLFAIDATKRGDITRSGLIWKYGGISRSISTVAISNGLLFAADLNGFVHCVDILTGKAVWTHDLMAAIWGSPMIIDGKVYIGTSDGDVVILDGARTRKLLFQTNMGATVNSTPVPANGALFLTTRNTLFALEVK